MFALSNLTTKGILNLNFGFPTWARCLGYCTVTMLGNHVLNHTDVIFYRHVTKVARSFLRLVHCTNLQIVLFTARNLRRLCFYRCLSTGEGGVRGSGGRAWLGACIVKRAWMANGGGLRGKGGHAWQRGCAWQKGGVWRRGGMHGEGGTCVAKGACVAKGEVRGGGGHVWWRGACVVKGACMAKGAVHGEGGCAWAARPPPRVSYYEIRSVNARAVRILLECILVYSKFS